MKNPAVLSILYLFDAFCHAIMLEKEAAGETRRGGLFMELAVNTDFSGEFTTIEETKESLRLIAQAGFTHMHWCFEWDGDYLYAHSEMKQIREWMDEYGLKAKALHASKGSRGIGAGGSIRRHYRKDYTSEIEYNRAAGVELVQNRVELAHILGAAEIVLHMYLPYADFAQIPGAKERFYRQAEKSLNELLPFCKERNVKICLENLFEAPKDLQLEQFTRLFSRYPADFLGLCLDTGHANLAGGNAFIKELAERFGGRLYCIHVHDNRGWGDQPGCGDAHMLPGECVIDWDAFITVLGKSAYCQPLLLEVCRPAGENDAAYLSRAFEAGKRLTEMISR